MDRHLFHIVFLLCPFLLVAQVGPAPNDPALGVASEDMIFEQRADGGFHLYIRKKPGIASVLLTESTRDPALRENNYSYRAAEWNPVNGDEIRLIDVPPGEGRIYSLVDSTPEAHPVFGQAFHIFIPYILLYGYESTRHGEVYVVNGTYLNIRAFSLPYADYRGPFRDNPFVLEVTQRPLPGPPEGNYMKETIAAFSEIGRNGVVYSRGPEDLVEKIRNALLPERGKTLDLVLCLDTTGSMKDDIDSIKIALTPMLRETLAGFPAFRIGMVLYRDYAEEYLTKKIAFTSDLARFQETLNGVRVQGGGDIPEAVYEALYEAALGFPWEAESRMIILAGDAPPHLRQRGKVSKEMVFMAAKEKNIKVNAIILPQ
jgi:hypothetical protein